MQLNQGCGQESAQERIRSRDTPTRSGCTRLLRLTEAEEHTRSTSCHLLSANAAHVFRKAGGGAAVPDCTSARRFAFMKGGWLSDGY